MNLSSPPFRLALFLAFAACATVNLQSAHGQADSEKTRADLLKLHNRERRDDGEKPLKLNNKLTEAAQEYADYLAKSGKFSHTAKGTMSSRVKDAGYKPRAVGENIAVGQRSASSVLKIKGSEIQQATTELLLESMRLDAEHAAEQRRDDHGRGP